MVFLWHKYYTIISKIIPIWCKYYTFCVFFHLATEFLQWCSFYSAITPHDCNIIPFRVKTIHASVLMTCFQNFGNGVKNHHHGINFTQLSVLIFWGCKVNNIWNNFTPLYFSYLNAWVRTIQCFKNTWQCHRVP